MAAQSVRVGARQARGGRGGGARRHDVRAWAGLPRPRLPRFARHLLVGTYLPTYCHPPPLLQPIAGGSGPHPLCLAHLQARTRIGKCAHTRKARLACTHVPPPPHTHTPRCAAHPGWVASAGLLQGAGRLHTARADALPVGLSDARGGGPHHVLYHQGGAGGEAPPACHQSLGSGFRIRVQVHPQGGAGGEGSAR